MKVRVIERTNPDGRVQYIIQQKGILFGWRDGWLNSLCGTSCQDSFNSLQQAKDNLCYFDGSKCKEKVIYEPVT